MTGILLTQLFFYNFTSLMHTVSELAIKQTKNILQLEGVREK